MPTLVIARDDALLVASGGDGEDAGRWVVKAHLREASPLCLASDPNRPKRLYCGTFGNGVWRSDDGGDSWVWVGQGLPRGRVTAIAVSGLEQTPAHGRVYAGTDPSAVLISDDGGEMWEERPGLDDLPSAAEWSFPPRPKTHHVRWIECDPHRAGRIYVSIEAGALIRSKNGGRSWEDRTEDGPRDAHSVLTHPLARDRIYAAAGDGYFESRDGGDSWGQWEAGLGDRYVWSLAVDPRDPDTVLVSASPGPTFAHDPKGAESRVYRRARGVTWEPVMKGLPPALGMTAPILAIDPVEPGVYYAACNRGVYRSANGGHAWEPLAIPWSDDAAGRRIRSLLVVP
jgi:photosystem II stability/assembly factor-like uncharacterized protein